MLNKLLPCISLWKIAENIRTLRLYSTNSKKD